MLAALVGEEVYCLYDGRQVWAQLGKPIPICWIHYPTVGVLWVINYRVIPKHLSKPTHPIGKEKKE